MKTHEAPVNNGTLRLRKILALALVVALLLLSACSLTGGNPATTEDGSAARQQTQVARSVAQTLAAAPPAVLPSVSTTAPLDTPMSAPMVSVSVDTNCRTGPGESFEIVGILRVGESAQVVGRSQYNDNWIVQLSSHPVTSCWLWAYYATVTGDTSALPVVTPPATPTPSAGFTATYLETRDCFPSCNCWGLAFQLLNTGTVTWVSYQITVYDADTGETFSYYENSFTDSFVCAGAPPILQDLEPGESGVAGNWGPGNCDYDPAGHHLTVTFKLCSQEELAGVCQERTISVTP